MRKFKNSLIAFAGLLTLIAVIAFSSPHTALSQKTGKAASSNPSNVNVVNTPDVHVTNGIGLASGTQVAITGTPSVNVNGTPNVNITNTPTVNVANMPTVTVASEGTVLALDQTVLVGMSPTLLQVDVSAFKEIRVWAALNSGTTNYVINLQVIDPNSPQLVQIDSLNGGSGNISKVYDIVAHKIGLALESQNSSSVHVQVYGRVN
jgi:hypothetical protein